MGKRGALRHLARRFLLARRALGGGVVMRFTYTLHVDLLGFTEFPTVFTLRDRTTLLLDFEKGTIGMLAGGRTMTFDACFTCIFSAADEYHVGRE